MAKPLYTQMLSKAWLVPLLCASILLKSPCAIAETSPGISFDLQGYIDNAIGDGKTYIKIPEGRHRVEPASNGAHLSLINLSNITIDGTGAEMICTHTTRAVSINDCTNLTIIGLTVDYDPLPFTQGRIVGISEDKRTLSIELMEGYPGVEGLKGDKLEVFDFNTEELVTSTYYNVIFEPDGSHGVIASKPLNYNPEISHEKIGDIAVIAYGKSGKTIPHAISSTNCNGLVMKDVTLFGSNSFGFLENDCSGSRYINCIVDRRPLETDLKPRSHRRMRSLNADAFHSKHALEGPSYVQCLARYMGDDGIAINGHYHIITECDGLVLRVIGKRGNSPNMVVGDTAELVSYTGERIEDAVITAIEPGTALNDAEREFLNAQNFNGNVQDTRDATLVYYVTLDREVNLPMGSLIASGNRVGNGFEVRDCIIGPNRSRGILVKASNGLISENRLVENWGQAIKLAPEYGWLEAGSGSNVTVVNNTITGCRDAAIAIYATGGNGEIAPAGAHNEIRVIGNIIRNSVNPAIAVTSTRGLKLYGNTIEAPDNSGLVPWRLRQFGREEDSSREVYLENVEDVLDAPSSKLEQWRDRYHIAQDGSEDLADFAGDSIPALIKLAFNLGNPRTGITQFPYLDVSAPENGGFPALWVQQGITYNFIRLVDDNSVMNYLSEYTPDPLMISWEPIVANSELYESISSMPLGDSGYELVSILLREYAINGIYFRVNISTSQL